MRKITVKRSSYAEFRKSLRKIKLSILFFILGVNIMTANYVLGQDAILRLNLELKNKSLKEVLNQIEKNSNYIFFYNDAAVDVNRKISISAKGESIEKILDESLKGSSTKYKIVDRQIILYTEGKEDSSLAKVDQDSKKKVKGKISDTAGEPLIGVSIQEKGKTTGTITDMDGNFTFDVDPNATLVISYLGYKTLEVATEGKASFDLVLKEDVSQLDEVVVVGYGVQKKASLTGAISNIGSSTLERSSATTTSGALVGKIAGVNTRQSDGRPGASTGLTIRNMGTPLYVIDGVQKDEAQFNNLDFNDIESISVLKDASAAIYGVKAANGVVVVTTKKGKRDTKNEVSFNGYYGWQEMFKYPRPADAATYVASYIQSDAITHNPTPTYTMDDLAKWRQGTEKGYVPFDWYDYILTTGPQWYVNASTSGGSEKINYYLSVGHLDQEANIKNYGGFERTNIQFNLDAEITKRLKLGASMNGRIEKRIHPGVPGGDDTWQALFATYRNLPTKRPFANDNPAYPQRTASDPGINFGMMTYDLMGKYTEDFRVMQLTVNGEYDFGRGLKAKGVVGYYLSNKWMDNQEYTYNLYRYDEATNTYPVDFSMTNPWRERDIRMVEEIMSQFQLNYANTFGKNSISAMGAVETYQRDTPGFWVHARPAANVLHLLDKKSVDDFKDDGVNTEARIGYIGRLNYDYAQKYLLEVSARYDGSWKFPPNHRWGFFPSASAGWRISEEGFWKDSKLNDIVNDFKIRASYGLVGDDNLGKEKDDYQPFDYLDGYTYGRYASGDEIPGRALDGSWVVGTQARKPAVTNLTWLKSKIFDAGFDFGFFGGKLTGGIDYFRRTRNGLPTTPNDVLMPVEVGFSIPKENLNSDVHTGMDGSIMWASKAGNVTYFAGGNFTYARKYDWDQYNPRFNNSWDQYRNSTYQRYAYLNWGYEVVGQFQSWEEIASYTVDNDRQGNKTLRPGDLKYKDINGDGRIDKNDERPIGYQSDESTPYFNFGINLGANYKGFDFAVDFTGAAYSSYLLDWESRNPFHDGGNNPDYYMSNQWRLSDISNPNSELIPGKYPTLIVGNSSHSDYWKSSFWMLNVNYVKLRNLEFGYTVPNKVTSKWGMQKVRVYTLMQNLFSIDNLGDIEIDPELSGSSGVHYPTNRVINFGLNLTF